MAELVERVRAGRRLFSSTGRCFGRRWWWSTLLVLIAVAVSVRLGLWQLDRLEQRRARNADFERKLASPPVSITGGTLPADLSALENRHTVVRGTFDLERQVSLIHQNWQGRPGVHLLTPLRIEKSERAVLVDRGWIPYELSASEKWSRFDVSGPTSVEGFLRLTQTLQETNVKSPAAPQQEWFRVDIEAIQTQIPYDLLPVYVMQSPGAGPESVDTLPHPVELQFDLSDGPHLGYAIQFFFFGLLLAVGYARYVSKRVDDFQEST